VPSAGPRIGRLAVRDEAHAGRTSRLLARLQLLHDLRDGALELRVLPLYGRLRIVFDVDVGIHPVALDHPLPLDVGEPGLGDEDVAAVEERAAPRDADDAAPRPAADERPGAGFSKHVGEDVAVARRSLVEDRGHGA
jgi:hypothetical protein